MQSRDICKMDTKKKYIKLLKFASISLVILIITPFYLNNANAQQFNAEQQADLLKRGKRMFLRCRTCHTLEKGGKHGTGPNLHGIFGSKSASKEGFSYSKALQNSDITWSEETINTWMSKPRDFVKGTTMAFVGLKKPRDREALITYLKENTK